MTALKALCDIRLFEKSAHLLVVSPAKRVLSPELRQTSPARPILNASKRYSALASRIV
jgi:hypothetical protein